MREITWFSSLDLLHNLLVGSSLRAERSNPVGWPRRLRLLAMTTIILSAPLSAQQLQTDPGGTFSIVTPGVLLPCNLNPGYLDCPANNPVLTIRVQTVKPGASVELMALNAEETLEKKSNFKMVAKEHIVIDGNKVIVQTMTFNNLANVTLPVVVRTVDSVLGTRAFELEVACNQSSCKQYMDAFDQAITSLHLAKPGQKLKVTQPGSLGGLQGLLNGL